MPRVYLGKVKNINECFITILGLLVAHCKLISKVAVQA